MRRVYNAQQEAVALWRYLEGRGLRPTMNSVARTLRGHGVKFRNQDLWTWLHEFSGAHPGRKRGAVRAQNLSTRGAVGADLGRSPGAPSRANNVSLLEIAEPSALPAIPQAGQVKSPPSSPRSPKLPLDAQVQDARRAILAAMWELLARTPFSASITKTEWGRRNSRVALDLATKGISAERIVAAYRAAEKRMGTPPRTLQIIQDQLGRMALPDAQRPNDKPAGARPAQYARCGSCDSFTLERELKPDQRFPRPICPRCVGGHEGAKAS